MFNLNRTDLKNAVNENSNLTKAQAKEAIEAIFDTVIPEALADGEYVNIKGFGKFDTKLRKARIGRNPSTNEEMEIPEKTVPKFTFGKGVKDTVAGEA